MKDAPADSIRRATPSDMTEVGRLGALLVRTHHDFDPKRFIAATSETARDYGSFLASQLEQPDVIVLVAERDGKGSAIHMPASRGETTCPSADQRELYTTL